MGRPRKAFVDLDTEKRRSYRRGRYYTTREKYATAQAHYHALQINDGLQLDLTGAQLSLLADYIKENFKFKLAQSADGCPADRAGV